MKISRTKLIAAMDAVRPGLSPDAIVEQADAFIFTGTHIVTFNDEIMVTCPFKTEASAAVRASEFYSLMQKCKDEELELFIEPAKDDLPAEFRVKGGKLTAGITMYAEIGKLYTAIGAPKQWKDIPADFFKALKSCKLSASSDTSVPALTCVHVLGRLVESCDRYRLTRWTLAKSAEAVFDKQMLIPARSVDVLLQYEVTQIGWTQGWVHFKGVGITVACRMFTANYPDLNKLLGGTGAEIEFPAETEAILERAGIFSDAGTAKGITSAPVTISLREGRVVASSEGTSGWIKERMPMEYKGPPVEFTINSALLTDILGRLRKGFINQKNILEMPGENFVHAIVLKKAEEG